MPEYVCVCVCVDEPTITLSASGSAAYRSGYFMFFFFLIFCFVRRPCPMRMCVRARHQPRYLCARSTVVVVHVETFLCRSGKDGNEK